jgi:hypothetical protein
MNPQLVKFGLPTTGQFSTAVDNGFAACTACGSHSYKAATLPALFAGPAGEDLRAAAYMGDCRPLALR